MTKAPKPATAETVEGRVEQALDLAGLNVAEMLRRLEVGKNIFGGWKKGAKMPASFLQAVIAECAKQGKPVNGHWLLTGDGSRNPPGVAERAYAEIVRLTEDPERFLKLQDRLRELGPLLE